MTEIDDFESFDREISQDFSEIGIDKELASLIIADIDPSHPDQYENASLWGQLIVEAAADCVDAKADGIDSFELELYLGDRLSLALPEGEYDKRVNEFTQSFNNVAITRYGTRRFPNGGFGTFNEIVYSPSVVGDFIGRNLQWDDLAKEAEHAIEAYRDGFFSFSTKELIEQAKLLDAIRGRRMALADPEYDGRWGEPRPRLGRGIISFDSRVLDEAVFNANERAEFAEASAGVFAAEANPEMVEKFGAKGANLMILDDALQKLKQHDVTIAEDLEIPRFTLVSSDVYERAKQGGRIVDEVLNLKKWMGENPDKRYLIRSSAVYTEDGEHTGAGIYETVLLPLDPTSRDIYIAIKKVYGSVESETARAYRESLGVSNEKMALVVQEFAGYDSDRSYSDLVTVNTVSPYALKLADFSIETGPHPLDEEAPEERDRHRIPLDRNGMHIEFGTTGTRRSLQSPRWHVPPDTRFISPEDTWQATQAAIFAEKALGRPVQLEAVLGETAIQIVQARPLPTEWLEETEFHGFPENEEPWYEGKSVGVYNGVEAKVHENLGFLIGLDDELGEGGFVLNQWSDSYAKGRTIRSHQREILALTPEQRARLICLILSPPQMDNISGYGHLETLFAELGVGLVFYDRETPYSRSFVRDQIVRVYSDGYKARLYSNQDDPAISEYHQWHNEDDLVNDALNEELEY